MTAYTKQDLDKPYNDYETLREFIQHSEDEIGMGNADLDNMTDSQLSEHVEFIEYLWTK